MPAQEVRKVIKLGDSQAITLPKPFAIYHKIVDGEEMIILYDSLILIVPKGAEEKFRSREKQIREILE